VLDRGKMSKSTGGFITLQTLVNAGYDPLDYRYFLVGGHYRTQLQFSYEALDGAKNARKSLNDRIRALAARFLDDGKQANLPDGKQPAAGKAAEYLAAFTAACDSDLSTPRALAELWTMLKDSDVPAEAALNAAFGMDEVLGLRLAETAKAGIAGATAGTADDGLAAEVEALIAERLAAKKAKDFAKADGIRASLKERGVILEDTPKGTVWHRE
jgi:cysteinyl-tRNA synthetase